MRLPDVRLIRRELIEYNRLLEMLPQDLQEWQTAAWERKLQRHAAILADELWEVTKLIAAIPDEELRLIFELRYFRGFSWTQVAAELPTHLSPGGVRMKHDRYLGGLSQRIS